MKQYTKKEVKKEEEHIIKAIRAGKVFVYPTDTIYGIGCNAEKASAVKKVRSAKKQFSQPMSIIAPGKRWIREHFAMEDEEKEWVKQLPGPYTLILKPKEQDEVVTTEATLGLPTVGVRYPDNWFTQLIKKAGVPFVTTSVNKHGEPNLTDPCAVPKHIAKYVDYLIIDGKKCGDPSTIVDCSVKPIQIKRRKAKK